jgi:hypothetical protein
MNKLITYPGPGEPAAPDPHRHRRKCSVCKHPEREAIEDEFLEWRSPQAIGAHYGIHKNSIYCHAHAMGLFVRRRGNMRSALEILIEQAEYARITGQTIINALRAYSCLQDDGRWVEPPTHVIYSVERSVHPDAGRAGAGPTHTMDVSPEERRAYPANSGETLRNSAGRFMGVPPEISQDSPQPDEILIVSPNIRNDANPMETNEEVKV